MLYSFLYIFVLFPIVDFIGGEHTHWDRNIIVGIIFAVVTSLFFPLWEGK